MFQYLLFPMITGGDQVTSIQTHSIRPRRLATKSRGAYSPPTQSFPADDPFTYSSGHWLRSDQKQRESRFLKFDFEALCSKVAKSCPGASRVVGYEKREGGFNRVFLFSLNNGQSIVAKVPFPLAGPLQLTTASEVATMQYRMYKQLHVSRNIN